MNHIHTVAVLSIIALITLATRALPFLVFGSRGEISQKILYIGRVLPLAVIAVLVVYCLRSLNLFTYPFGLPELISMGLIVILHLWKNSTILSVLGGTACYMILIRTLFKI
ncbi:MAG: branched-chain amino acid transporter AzlD [Clostridiales bacterium]|nr:branched-chain amino acid transporter AzlD [Clostridiales bacterium]